ncbi:MAG: transcriptional regulator [Clostridiales bacterium]|jgi:LacI family transcriptional regulator|nr:transcriptional regulator [Clostridiales bacterium]
MVGIKDIAKVAGVSVSTVSNVVNGKKNVGESTRERVMSICKEMSYYPNSVGKTLKTGNSNTILFNFSDFDRSFFLKIINGISDYVKDNDFDLIICTEKSCEKYMRNNLTCGSIVLDKKMKDEVLNKIAGEDYPIVVLDRVIDNPYIKSVVVNNYAPMSELVQGLVDRGYRRFGFVGGPEHTADNKERYRAFRDVLETSNIDFQQKSYFAGDYREKSGYTAAKILMLSQELPDALVCANDNMAIGAIKAFQDNGVRVPEDIAVTGFDNCDLADHMGLTTVSIPNYERGYIAAQYLIENIRGNRNVEPFKISAKIKWRNSVSVKKSKI